MSVEHTPASAEQRALDRPWRMWASIAVGTFALVAIVVGFIILPLTEGGPGGLLGVICRAIGVPGFEDTVPAPPAVGTVQPASLVSWTPAVRSVIAQGKAADGATIAADVCSGCHGEAGLGADGSFPRIAHQAAEAIYKELQDYKSGSRQGGQADTMAGIAQGLSDQQMADVAQYYAALGTPIDSRPVPTISSDLIMLAQEGDTHRALPSCDACHGGDRTGPEGAPVLWGQYSSYLEGQLKLFASGERANDLYGRMRDVAARLTPQEISGMAIYYGIAGNPAQGN